MERERSIEIAKAYARIARPWTSLGLEPPLVAVIQVAREAGIPSPATVAKKLANGGIIFDVNGNFRRRLVLKDSEGTLVEDWEDAAKRVTPYKRAVKKAEYRSKAPGGGPVVKRRVNEESLERKIIQLGMHRLKVGIEEYSEDEERKEKRKEIKRKLAGRWIGRMPIESDPIISQAENALSLIKKLSERRGIAKEAEIFRRLKTNIESGRPQVILAIWGPPYEGQGYQDVFDIISPEEKMARGIINAVNQLQETTEVELVILYADYYGTDINGLSRGEVENYGQQIEARFKGIGRFICWSELREKNWTEYKSLKDSFSSAIVKPTEDEVNRAFIMQAKLGYKITKGRAIELAKMYKTERIIEGIIIQEGFRWGDDLYTNIIKLGTAPSKANDEPYEAQLPRFYVSGMLRAAWNRPR